MKQIILLPMLLLAGLPVLAQRVQPQHAATLITAEQAVAAALQANFSIAISQQQLKIAENDISRGNAGFLPTLNANGSNVYGIADIRQVFATATPPIERRGARNHLVTGQVALNWTIFDGFAMFTNYERLREIRSVGEEQAKTVVDNTVALVLATYFNIIRQQDQVKVLEDAVRLSQLRRELARNKYEVGSGTKMEYLYAQVDLNADSTQLVRQKQALQNARIDLNNLLVRQPLDPVQVSDTIYVDEQLQLDALTQTMLSLNPQLLRAQRKNNLAYLNERLGQSLRYPTVSLITNYTYNDQTNGAGLFKQNTSKTFNYGAQASWNLFDGFNTNRIIQNARINREISRTQIEQLQLQLKADLQKAWIDYQNSLQLTHLERQNVKVAQQNADIVMERYRIGVATPIEFREAQRNAVAAEGRLIDALYQAKMAEVELRRLSGKLVRS